jgi:hypothetical protein
MTPGNRIGTARANVVLNSARTPAIKSENCPDSGDDGGGGMLAVELFERFEASVVQSNDGDRATCHVGPTSGTLHAAYAVSRGHAASRDPLVSE